MYVPDVQGSYSAPTGPSHANGIVKSGAGRWNDQSRANCTFDITIAIASSGEVRQDRQSASNMST